MFVFDLNNNLFIFLGKNKTEIINLLNQHHIVFDFFPEEQRNQGYDIIELCDYSVLIWFDCDNICYAVDIKDINQNIFIFDGNPLNNSNFLDYLQETAIKFTQKVFHDGLYPVKDYFVYIFEYKDEKLNDIFLILNTKLNHEILEIGINYDGYGPFYYKKGISLNEYLVCKSF